MAALTGVTNTFNAGDTIVASEVNVNFQDVVDWASGVDPTLGSGASTVTVGNNLVVPAATTTQSLTVDGISTLTGAVTASAGITGNVTGNVTGSSGSCTGNAATATTAGTVTTNAQPAITSVGTLGSLTVSGNGTFGSLAVTGTTTVSGNIHISTAGDQIIFNDSGDSHAFRIYKNSGGLWMEYSGDDGASYTNRIQIHSTGVSLVGSVTSDHNGYTALATASGVGADGTTQGSIATAAINTSTTSGYQPVYRNNAYGTLYRYSSKAEYKENITAVTDTGGMVDALRPVTFVPKATGVETAAETAWRQNDINYGFIAEEIALVGDGKFAVWDDEDGDLVPVSWRQNDVISLLTAELQSVRTRIAALEAP